MAGESPDKSVDEETPGAAESSAERDPRLSVFRPRASEDGAVVARKGEGGAEADAEDGGDAAEADADADTDADADAAAEAEAESGGRDALREAVAAWVATESTAAEKATTDSADAD
ncbi:hypothetical protein ACFCYA_37730, partial [Streptomyces virginiae]